MPRATAKAPRSAPAAAPAPPTGLPGLPDLSALRRHLPAFPPPGRSYRSAVTPEPEPVHTGSHLYTAAVPEVQPPVNPVVDNSGDVLVAPVGVALSELLGSGNLESFVQWYEGGQVPSACPTPASNLTASETTRLYHAAQQVLPRPDNVRHSFHLHNLLLVLLLSLSSGHRLFCACSCSCTSC